jgi:hypothetical protein
MSTNGPEQSEFEQGLEKNESVGFFAEFLDFLGENKKWWLLPILLIMILFSALVFLSGSGAAPFIYTLF